MVDCDLVEGTNVIDMKLRAGLLARASTESVPLFDKSNPINVTLGIEMKKIVEVRIFFDSYKPGLACLFKYIFISIFILIHGWVS